MPGYDMAAVVDAYQAVSSRGAEGLIQVWHAIVVGVSVACTCTCTCTCWGWEAWLGGALTRRGAALRKGILRLRLVGYWCLWV